MPWHQISHLPADQSLKKLTRHSPDLCHVHPIDLLHLTDFMQCRDHYMTPPVSLAILPSIQKTAFLASYEIRQNAAHLFSSEVVGSSCDPTHPMGRMGTAQQTYIMKENTRHGSPKTTRKLQHPSQPWSTAKMDTPVSRQYQAAHIPYDPPWQCELDLFSPTLCQPCALRTIMTAFHFM